MQKIKQKLLRTLLQCKGDEKVVDCLTSIYATYNILEQEFIKKYATSDKDKNRNKPKNKSR